MVKLVNDPVRGSSWITGQLRQAIQAGQYGHGDKLPAERQLAEAFGTSRTTVRAALDQLESERLSAAAIGSGTLSSNSPDSPRRPRTSPIRPVPL
ncbi:MAG: winged helix-turn-helix transcriptional regulator, partial [Rhodospirillaceae bacterium]|nr:winged helix-turn-helix transcriptional regulator [Rhodospirillaceae bacterium]